MESLLKNLKKHVECSICLDTFTEPKTIACLHTFCCECLKKHALVSQRDGQFRCPECQTQIALPEGNNFDELPTGFLHNSLLSLVTAQQSGDGSEISCSLCKKRSAEASYCFDCEKFLCGNCVNAHELFREAAFSGHKLSSVEKFQAEDYEALLKRKTFCSVKYHEREVTRFYCRVCQTCICQMCINADPRHKNHEIEPIEKAADEERAKILAGVDLMNQKNEICNNIFRQLEETTSNLESDIAIAKRKISQAAERMIHTVHERERDALTALENSRVSRINEIDAVMRQVELVVKQIKKATEFATELAQRSSCSDIMRTKENLGKRFEELTEIQFRAIPNISSVKFVSTIEPGNLSLGFIKSSETDPNGSTFEGLQQNFQAGVEAEITICPRTPEGQISNRQHEDHVEVQVQPADQLASLNISEEAGGNVKVKFVPKLPGVYNILAKINGKNVGKSPFNIEVEERKLKHVGEVDLQNLTIKGPGGLAVNSKGLIAIADFEKHCILVLDKDGKLIRKLGCYGKNPGQFDFPAGVTFLNDDEILVADNRNNRIQQFNVQSGSYVRTFGRSGKGDGEFSDPCSVCVDAEGHIIVAEYGNNRVQVLTKDGAPVLRFRESGQETLKQPTGCFYYKDMFIISDSENGCLKVFDSSGSFLRKIGEKGNGHGQFIMPWALCVDKHGNILVSDKEIGHVKQFTIEGRFTGKTVSKLAGPFGVATLPDGRILISESGARKLVFLK